MTDKTKEKNLAKFFKLVKKEMKEHEISHFGTYDYTSLSFLIYVWIKHLHSYTGANSTFLPEDSSDFAEAQINQNLVYQKLINGFLAIAKGEIDIDIVEKLDGTQTDGGAQAKETLEDFAKYFFTLWD